MNPAAGRGFWGRGRGGGRAWRRGWTGGPAWVAPVPYPPVEPEQQIDAMKAQADYFEKALGDLRERISELEAGKDK
jgi:hypothetical protein